VERTHRPFVFNSGNEVRFATDQALVARYPESMAETIPVVVDEGLIRER